MINLIKKLFTPKTDNQIKEEAQLKKGEYKLRFEKTDNGKYNIVFYNPIKQSWWILPDMRAAIHEKWTINSKGSYGAYNLHKLTCRPEEIEEYKKQFSTLESVELYFEKMNKKYEEFVEHIKKQDALPQIIE